MCLLLRNDCLAKTFVSLSKNMNSCERTKSLSYPRCSCTVMKCRNWFFQLSNRSHHCDIQKYSKKKHCKSSCNVNMIQSSCVDDSFHIKLAHREMSINPFTCLVRSVQRRNNSQSLMTDLKS